MKPTDFNLDHIGKIVYRPKNLKIQSGQIIQVSESTNDLEQAIMFFDSTKFYNI